jgi:transketolase
MEKQEKAGLREAMVQALIEAVQDNVNLAVLVSDSTSTSKIAPFQEKYPERLVNVGIAEQNLIGVAAGLALGGYVAVTANAAPFLIARANEQVKNDVCYSETNVKLVGLNAGVCYGALASTHHTIDDISIMCGLGNILILAPSDAVDTKQIVRFALDYDGPVYIRMDSDTFPILHGEDYQFTPGQVDVLQTGDDVTIVAVGSVTCEAVAAAEELKSGGINAEVLNLSSIRPLEKSGISASLRKTGRVVTVEEHSLHGGIGSLVAELIADERLDVTCTRLGITEGQFSKAGPRGEIRTYYNIDKNGIVNAVKKIIEH